MREFKFFVGSFERREYIIEQSNAIHLPNVHADNVDCKTVKYFSFIFYRGSSLLATTAYKAVAGKMSKGKLYVVSKEKTEKTKLWFCVLGVKVEFLFLLH